MTADREQRGCATWLICGLLICLIAYIPSSGPVLASAFWLREATGWDGFYWVMFIYLPLLALGHDNPIDDYIEWWVEFFGTVGPG
jgi:hypothetical protein